MESGADPSYRNLWLENTSCQVRAILKEISVWHCALLGSTSTFSSHAVLAKSSLELDPDDRALPVFIGLRACVALFFVQHPGVDRRVLDAGKVRHTVLVQVVEGADKVGLVRLTGAPRLNLAVSQTSNLQAVNHCHLPHQHSGL